MDDMIDKFPTVYAGHVDLGDMGSAAARARARPRPRRFSSA
jgi:hypothetical protein